MYKKTIYYAMHQLELIGIENGFKPYIQNDSIYIELKNGKTLKIADDEIKYQASEYLKSELESINF